MQWKWQNKSTPKSRLLNPPNKRNSRKYVMCVTQSRLVLPCPFKCMTNIHFHTRKSQEEPLCSLKVFTATLQAALLFSCHLHHKWRPSILDSGCKYLWSACSQFLNCHITWGCTGWWEAAELGKTHQRAPSFVPICPTKDRRGSNRDAKGWNNRMTKDRGSASARWRGPSACLLHACSL